MKHSTLSPSPLRRGALHIRTDTPSHAGRTGLAVIFLLLLALAGWRLADAWRQTERREATLPQLEAMARQAPDDGPLLALLGGRRAEAHQASAADSLRRAIAAGEQSELVWQTLAAVVAAGGDRPRALADLRLGIKALGPLPRLQSARARAEALGPSPDPSALTLALAPEGAEPLVASYTQGSILNGLARWWGRRFPERSGFATREEWARQEPNNAQAQRLWGLALRENGRLPEAGAALARAVDLAPRSPAAHLAFADALQQGGFGEKAGLEYIACLKLHPDWLPALLGLGSNALSDHLGHAAPAFRRATQIAPQSVDAWVGLGRASLTDTADTALSVSAFETAARLAPARTDFLDAYAQALRQASRGAETEPLLRRRLRAAPDDAQGHYLLGQALMDSAASAAGEADAEAETREALRLSPRQPLAELQLAQLLLRRGQARKAMTLLQDARAALPYDITLLNVLTRAARQAGDTKLANSVSVLSKQVFSDQQEIRVVEIQKHQDVMNIGVHTRLAALYTRTGKPILAQQEQEMVRLLRTEPQKVQQDQQFLRASLRQILPDTSQ